MICMLLMLSKERWCLQSFQDFDRELEGKDVWYTAHLYSGSVVTSYWLLEGLARWALT